jgi:hypothetical protein
MTLSATLQARAELHPEPTVETVEDLITDIREAAEDLYTEVTHLDLRAEPGYAPYVLAAWVRLDTIAELHGRLAPATAAWTEATDAMDTAQWIADTFTALLDRDPADEVITEIEPGTWRITLNPPRV